MSVVKIACPCPGEPHESDTVDLRDRLGLAAGIAIQRLVIEANKIAKASDSAEVSGMLAEAYLLHGIEAWSLTDANGKPMPLNADTIRTILLSDFAVAAPIANVADDLYMGAVILPLVVSESRSSPTTPMGESTSASRHGPRPRPKPSKRSSTGTIPTDGTGTTSPSRAGDYS